MPTLSKRSSIGVDAAKVLIAVEAVRSVYHACTVTAAAEQLQWNRSSTYVLIRELVDGGLLTMSELPGSIFVTEEGHEALADSRSRRGLGPL